MNSIFVSRPLILVMAFVAPMAIAQTASVAPRLAASLPSFATALDAAWQLTPAHNTADARRDDVNARLQALNAPLAGPAVATVAHRTDRLGLNQGLSEWEGEVSAPLWNSALRQALRKDINADGASLAAQQTLARLKLAGEMRQLMTDHASALADVDASQARVADAKAVVGDVSRRVKSGDAPRIDALGAQGALSLAELGLLQSQTHRQRIGLQWRALTGLADVSDVAANTPIARAVVLNDHPAMVAAQLAVQAAAAKLDAAMADRNDPMSVSVGLSRERSAFGSTPTSNVRVALTMPLSTVFGNSTLLGSALSNSARNGPKIAAARLALVQTQAELDATERQLNAELASLDQAMPLARRSLALTKERAAATNASLTLIAKAYALGEGDWATRQRAQLERDEATFAVNKASTELMRLQSQRVQAAGEMP